jgi:hypothetical protein
MQQPARRRRWLKRRLKVECPWGREAALCDGAAGGGNRKKKNWPASGDEALVGLMEAQLRRNWCAQFDGGPVASPRKKRLDRADCQFVSLSPLARDKTRQNFLHASRNNCSSLNSSENLKLSYLALFLILVTYLALPSTLSSHENSNLWFFIPLFMVFHPSFLH